ncbi:hypothetical protein [Curtobacterium sp. MCBD17_030]|uniref:hypothetical protein n=1 Tax=Curtobacterium sp. MCBD17_030 TaxID=2175649 RepID=UPI000D829EB2|nr:hypothetical protein [Curtobacterium sp. MCBD17_030]PYY32771.1 hypothetical protein DEI89_11875 [Curtobacterium sp. MCBD17_030]
MSDTPVLLFLHGVGSGDMEDGWRTVLSQALEQLGYPSLDEAQVIAPKYAHALKGTDYTQSIPELTIKQPARDAARQNRRDFERRMGAVEFRLGRHNGGHTVVGTDLYIGAAVATPPFMQARNYLTRNEIRAQVLRRVLDALPEAGTIVIVAHSLGTVIAADLIRRLPVGLTVAGMVTIGSPLAHGSFGVDDLRSAMVEPPTNLQWWVNFWNAPDLVAAHRGVSSVFPWMLDFRIDTKTVLLPAHAAVGYLANEAVAAAIGYALFGSLAKAVTRVETALDGVIDPTEQVALVALRYAHLLKARLKGDQQDRFMGALRHVQASVVDEITARAASEKRGLPSTVTRLAFDLADPIAVVPEPLPSQHLSGDDAVVLMTVLAAENVIRPFEIEVDRDKWQEAMADLTAEMGLTSRYGSDVFAAAKEARRALSGGVRVNWVKFGALGAGAAAIVVATGGLALAAGAGLAGAAVITSALAAFGPGGMVGGLLTAGTLLTAGGGGIAFGLAGATTTAETLEAVVERRLAAEIFRKKRGFEPDPTAWTVLTDIEREVRREHERLDEFSDESAPTLKDLKRKITAVERALKYLRENDLEPALDGNE